MRPPFVAPIERHSNYFIAAFYTLKIKRNRATSPIGDAQNIITLDAEQRLKLKDLTAN